MESGFEGNITSKTLVSKQLIVIDGLSSMGKSSTAKALKAKIEMANPHLKVGHSSIDFFYQTKLWATEIKMLDRGFINGVDSWDNLFYYIERFQRQLTPLEARLLQYKQRIKYFFTNINVMTPRAVYANTNFMDDARAFYRDIASSLEMADVVIIDHEILLHGEEKWRGFVQGLDDVTITYITLTCDHESYQSRIAQRNLSQNLSDHRKPAARFDDYSRWQKKRQQDLAAFFAGVKHWSIDTSVLNLDDVVNEIVESGIVKF
jgi:deoxyadenosine/deoxycytidine kinase